MSTFEIDATIGPNGNLALEHLPFVNGQSVHVRIEPKPEPAPPRARVLGLHAGAVTISDDFDAPLPDSFWLGESGGSEASA